MKESNEIEARAKVFWEGGLKTRSIIRGFEVETDKPKSDFGTNTAPAPLEIFIAGMGACILSTFIWSVWKTRVQIEDCTVDVRAYASTVENSEKVTKSTIKLTVWADKKHHKKLENCFNIARSSCTLTNAVSFPIESSFQIKDS